MASFFRSSAKSSGTPSPASSKAPSIAPGGPEHTPKTTEIHVEPSPGCGPKTKRIYTAEQEEKIEQLRQYAFTLLLPETDPYYPWELRFLSDPGCMPRYMRAAKWKIANAQERIKGTIEWRREYKPDLIRPDEIAIEAQTGKIVLSGFDIDGRPVITMRPGRENTDPSPRQIRHLIYILERAIDLMPPGVETVVILVDYQSASTQSNPSIGTARKVLHILQSHYVERMGRAIVTKTPWWVNAFFTAITPFLDPITKEKMRFNPNLSEIIDIQQLDAEYGGQHNYELDFDIYWKTLIDFCHIAPDGTRLDKDGNPAMPPPPLGYGAKAAAFGLEAIGGIPNVAEEQVQQVSQMTPAIIDESKRGNPLDEATKKAAEGVGASSTGQQDADRSETTSNGDKEVEHVKQTNDNGVVVSDETLAREMATVNLKDGSNVPGDLPATETNGTTDLPIKVAAKTVPGPPSGPVVFDHPPSSDEKGEARGLEETIMA